MYHKHGENEEINWLSAVSWYFEILRESTVIMDYDFQ